MNINKLDELASKSGMTVTDYLEEVIRRGWAAFFEIKNYDNKNRTSQPADKPNEYNSFMDELAALRE